MFVFLGEFEEESKQPVLSEQQKHQLKHRELFLSRQFESLPATHIRYVFKGASDRSVVYFEPRHLPCTVKNELLGKLSLLQAFSVIRQWYVLSLQGPSHCHSPLDRVVVPPSQLLMNEFSGDSTVREGHMYTPYWTLSCSNITYIAKYGGVSHLHFSHLEWRWLTDTIYITVNAN